MFNYFFSEYKRRYCIKWAKKPFKDIIKKRNTETTKEYKLRAIDNLIDLCKDPVFNLYTSEGIDWLLKMCDNEIKENIKRNSLDKSALLALWSTLSSVVGFIVGTVADNVDISEKINLTTLVIGLIICISVLFAIIAAFTVFYMYILPGLRICMNSKIQDLKTLIDNLEYIKACHASDLQKSERQDTSM